MADVEIIDVAALEFDLRRFWQWGLCFELGARFIKPSVTAKFVQDNWDELYPELAEARLRKRHLDC
ncbi:hypothetical protein JQ615_24810 [Bradyrhizobium jicamae]|uniref:Uncharacterized protein n=1 Tax=Bradyrhizobium jicamae TaxID=280332 RepID=A0ABS5FPB2_9BRAD|nr:hypothetical protein [Bradyrhizobium jicamae]MBR0798612.1 hypothetical protein [Bradyrhizobium jicamae]